MRILLGVLAAAMVFAQQPVFKGDKLARPENYREWIFLSSGLGMTYSGEPDRREPAFDNVFVSQEAYRSFVQTGAWPEKTMFILEVRDSATNGSINKGGQGKTTFTKTLATAAVEAGFNVLILDVDTQQNSVGWRTGAGAAEIRWMLHLPLAARRRRKYVRSVLPDAASGGKVERNSEAREFRDQ